MVIQFGDSGPNVLLIQNALNQKGAKLVADGQFGAMTEAAAKSFQAAHQLVADGIVGPATQLALLGHVIPDPAPGPIPSGGRTGGLLHVCQGGKVMKCFDVSSYQPGHNFGPARATFDVGICKASEGVGIADSTFNSHRAGLKQAGFKYRGFYHFYHPASDPLAQAKLFCRMVGQLEAGEFPVLDWETADGVPSARDVANAQIWLDYVEKTLGVVPWIYGGPYFLQALALDPSFARYPLWVAEYGPSCPLVPAPWSFWIAWQYSDKENVPGIGPCDVSIINGDDSVMDKYCKAA